MRGLDAQHAMPVSSISGLAQSILTLSEGGRKKLPMTGPTGSKIAYLGLGSNLGDRDANLREAIAALRAAPDVEVVRVSRFIETSPQGGPAQPDFLNAVAEVETSLSPRQLIHLLLEIETRFARVPHAIRIDVVPHSIANRGRQVQTRVDVVIERSG